MMTFLKTQRWVALLLLPMLLIPLGGCSDLLSVDNPNDLIEEDLDSPTSTVALANGALAAVSRAYSYMYAPYATTSDELIWTGSRDAWNQLDMGHVDFNLNEFTNAAFPFVGEARFMSDLAIDRIEAFDASGQLTNPGHLALAYHSGALIYVLIADMYEDFPVASSRREAAAPVGAANMNQLYDTAVSYLDKGIAIANAQGDTGMARAMLALRARTKHAKAVWGLLNPAGSAPANPLVNDAGAVADAQAYLGDVGTDADLYHSVDFTSTSVGNDIAGWVNQRSEMAVDTEYATFDANCNITTGLQDPVDGKTDPRTRMLVRAFVGDECEDRFPSLNYTSSREMHLILAEAALADNDVATAVMHINHVRDDANVDSDPTVGLTDYDPAAGGALSVQQQLEYERKANLYMFGRRLHDLYRFDVQPAKWESGSAAVKAPGTFFPIADIEVKANPNIGN